MNEGSKNSLSSAISRDRAPTAGARIGGGLDCGEFDGLPYLVQGSFVIGRGSLPCYGS